MKFRIVYSFLLILVSYQTYSQIDTLQTYDLESGSAFFLRENGVKKVILKKDTSSILILTETLDENNKVDSGTVIDGLYGVKSNNDLIGVMKRSKRDIIYSLFDISSGERKLINVFMFSPRSDFRIKYELLDCFTVLENYLEFQEKSNITRFSEDGYMQEFSASEKGRIPNAFYQNLMKFEK